jgi:hypothetical protein
MAINKRAKNLQSRIRFDHTVIAKTIEEQSEQVRIFATSKNLTLVGNKKIIMNGNK